MSTHNICFYGEISKIVPNYHQIPSLSDPLHLLLNCKSTKITQYATWQNAFSIKFKITLHKAVLQKSNLIQISRFNLTSLDNFPPLSFSLAAEGAFLSGCFPLSAAADDFFPLLSPTT